MFFRPWQDWETKSQASQYAVDGGWVYFRDSKICEYVSLTISYMVHGDIYSNKFINRVSSRGQRLSYLYNKA